MQAPEADRSMGDPEENWESRDARSCHRLMRCECGLSR
jgi:hypothetical protein